MFWRVLLTSLLCVPAYAGGSFGPPNACYSGDANCITVQAAADITDNLRTAINEALSPSGSPRSSAVQVRIFPPPPGTYTISSQCASASTATTRRVRRSATARVTALCPGCTSPVGGTW